MALLCSEMLKHAPVWLAASHVPMLQSWSCMNDARARGCGHCLALMCLMNASQPAVYAEGLHSMSIAWPAAR